VQFVGVAVGRSGSSRYLFAPVAHGCAFDTNGALFEVGLARDGIECAEGDDVGVGLGKVKGHEDLAGSDDARDAEFKVRDSATTAMDGDPIMGLEVETRRVGRVDLKPSVRHHVVEELYLCGLGAGVPMFHRAARVQDEVVFSIRLFDEGFAGDEVQLGAPISRGKDAVAIERFPAPLDTVGIVDLLPRKFAVVAHASGRDTLPLLIRVGWSLPVGVNLVANSQLFGQSEKDVEVRASFARRTDGRISFGDTPLGVGVGAFLLSPDSGRQNEVRKLAGGRGEI
jgi:hypothetical protein